MRQIIRWFRLSVCLSGDLVDFDETVYRRLGPENYMTEFVSIKI